MALGTYVSFADPQIVEIIGLAGFDAAFIDIRPALVQMGLRPSRADRFAADLGRASEIADERLRALVEAAAASPVPVVLGGHSLVAGVLMLLNDWAWEQRDRASGR